MVKHFFYYMIIRMVFMNIVIPFSADPFSFLILFEIFSNKMEALLNTMIPNQMLFIDKNFFQTRSIAAKEKTPAPQRYSGSVGEVSFYLIQRINTQHYFLPLNKSSQIHPDKHCACDMLTRASPTLSPKL
jgi:hypothetical protein